MLLHLTRRIDKSRTVIGAPDSQRWHKESECRAQYSILGIHKHLGLCCIWRDWIEESPWIPESRGYVRAHLWTSWILTMHHVSRSFSSFHAQVEWDFYIHDAFICRLFLLEFKMNASRFLPKKVCIVSDTWEVQGHLPSVVGPNALWYVSLSSQS